MFNLNTPLQNRFNRTRSGAGTQSFAGSLAFAVLLTPRMTSRPNVGEWQLS